MANLDTAPLTTSTVQAGHYSLAFGPSSTQEAEYDLTGAEGAECWFPLGQRLLQYFAKPFNTRTPLNLLERLMATVARELSGCSEIVALTDSPDARGDGAFHVFTRFAPITQVLAVKRVDEDGNVLEVYNVTEFNENKITVTGAKAPGHGDRLLVTYSYLFGGLEYHVRQALLELNVLTASGTFLDAWGRWFGVARQILGGYGSLLYGDAVYGADGRESDTRYSRRIIDRVTMARNAPNAIRDAVERVTGGPVYVIDWLDPTYASGWIYKVAADADWAGGSAPGDIAHHLIWGRTSRFINANSSGGGACVFEVIIPLDSPVPLASVLQVANAYKAAGTRCFVRYGTYIAVAPEAPSGLGGSSP
jgi:hypothetical protein